MFYQSLIMHLRKKLNFTDFLRSDKTEYKYKYSLFNRLKLTKLQYKAGKKEIHL